MISYTPPPAAAGIVTASNGLTDVGGNVILGGPLVHPTVINTFAELLRFISGDLQLSLESGVFSMINGPALAQMFLTLSGLLFEAKFENNTSIRLENGDLLLQNIIGTLAATLELYDDGAGNSQADLYADKLFINSGLFPINTKNFWITESIYQQTNVGTVNILLLSVPNPTNKIYRVSIDYTVTGIDAGTTVAPVLNWDDFTGAGQSQAYEVVGVTGGPGTRPFVLFVQPGSDITLNVAVGPGSATVLYTCIVESQQFS